MGDLVSTSSSSPAGVLNRLEGESVAQLQILGINSLETWARST